MIPFFGAKGAAVATVLAEVFIASLNMINCDRFLRLIDIWNCSYKRIIAGIIMAVIVRLMEMLPANGIVILIMQIAGGALIYITVLFILGDSFINKILKRRLV